MDNHTGSIAIKLLKLPFTSHKADLWVPKLAVEY